MRTVVVLTVASTMCIVGGFLWSRFQRWMTGLLPSDPLDWEGDVFDDVD